MKYSKNGQKFAMFKSSSNILFDMLNTMQKTALLYMVLITIHFFWMTRYFRPHDFPLSPCLLSSWLITVLMVHQFL